MARAIQERDIYASITLDKILASAGVTELEDAELVSLLTSRGIIKKEGIDIEK